MRPLTKITILGMRLGVFALIVYWLAMFIGTHIPALPRAAPKVGDKLLHFTAFFGLGLFLCYVSKPGPRLKRFGRIFLIVLVYAAVDELTQSLVPRRNSDWMDFLADASGVACAIVLYITAQIVVRRLLEIRSANAA